jgi:hypothetical protein
METPYGEAIFKLVESITTQKGGAEELLARTETVVSFL